VIDSQSSNARSQAAAILKAWGSHNLALLHRNLTTASEESPATVEDSGESERMEMLGAIAAKMRLLIEADQIYSAAQLLPLLRHLAAPPPGTREFAYSA
jgi:hypothetical protein